MTINQKKILDAIEKRNLANGVAVVLDDAGLLRELFKLPAKHEIVIDSKLRNLAWEAIKYVKEKLPLGSVNKKSDEAKENFSAACAKLNYVRGKVLWGKKDLINLYRENIPDYYSDRLVEEMSLAMFYEENKVGNCGEQAVVALKFLKDNGVDDVELCDIYNFDADTSIHTFLLIDGYLICDPWAEEVYPTSEFKSHQVKSKNFEYSSLESYNPPFLEGVPVVALSTSKWSFELKSIVDGVFHPRPKKAQQVESSTILYNLSKLTTGSLNSETHEETIDHQTSRRKLSVK